ncbi:MAG: glycosyltransferase family 39 protein [Phycisphaeraceae bacterium]|nr:glycosyltransferase family 39 protein [Phycisphaerales bacterium]MCB9859950.1 glycosyltransferase family 39 protein [Phycisphaeraceae bacterium]
MTDVDHTQAISRAVRTIVLIAVVACLARLIYLAFLCPYTLIEDEAHYWEWSRRLDWSYYSKGPGIAVLIRASTEFFHLFGMEKTELAVRAPAAIFGSVLVIAVGLLALRTTRNAHAGIIAAVLVLFTPAFQASALLMTIDGPFLACWALALLFAWMSLCEKGRWSWIGLGAAIGFGTLIKHTMLLILPGLALFALFALLRKRNRNTRTFDLAPTWQRWAASCVTVVLVSFAPMVIWNAQHDWDTLRHLLGHLGSVGESLGGDIHTTSRSSAPKTAYSPMWTLELVGMQVALLGGVFIVAVYGAFTFLRRRNLLSDTLAKTGCWFLLLAGLPVFVLYLGVTFVTRAEGNWPIAGWISLIAIGAWGVADAKRKLAQRISANASSHGRMKQWKPEFHRHAAYAITIVVGIVSGIGMLRLDLIAKLPGMAWIPLGRAMNADVYAKEVQQALDELRTETGQEPFFLAQHYGRASQMAFYLPSQPTVYCASSKMAGRRTQYDLWDETNLDNPDVIERLLGRPAIVLGGSPETQEQYEYAFEIVVPIEQFKGEHKKGRTPFKAYGFHGFR